MWGQAQELAQRTVQELAAASERISWLEGELAATREAAQGRGKPSLAQERGRAPLLYSGNAQVAALKQARERLEAAGDPGKIPEAVGILKGVTAELGALVMSTKPPEAEARAPRWADERCSFRQGGATPALSDKMASAHTSLNKQPPCGAKTSKASASGTGKPKATMKAAPPAVSKAKTTSGWRL